MRWGVDIDGVLSVFDRAYSALLGQIDPSLSAALEAALPPKDWYWTAKVPGLTPAHEKEAWRQIEDSECFWLDCVPYPETEEFLGILQGLTVNPCIAVYFLTARLGVTAKVQTEWWLEERGFSRPTVLICPGSKRPIINALELDLIIDDRPDTIVDLQAHSPQAMVYCQDRTWNQQIDAQHRVGSPLDMLVMEGVL